MEAIASELVRFSSKAHSMKMDGQPVEEAYASVTRMNIASANDHPLNVEMAMRFLPGVSIASISTSPYRIDRTREQTADGNDDFVLTLSRHSGIAARQPGREAEFNAGEAYLWRNDMAMTAISPNQAGIINIVVPMNVLMPIVADIDTILKDRIPASLPLKLLAGYAEGLMSDVALSPETEAMTASHIQDLIAAALGPQSKGHSERGGIRVARLAAIKRDILANLADPALSLNTLATRHRISPQYVRALFSQHGTTFSDYVREQRLQRAFRRLAGSRSPHMTISAIAYDCGFGELSWFNKTFKKRFKRTPSDVRTLGCSRGSN
jgi:AraC-like DNA-binding protein